MNLTRSDLVNLCEVFKAKALEEHELFKKWRNRAIEAESRLAIYEPGDEPTKHDLTDAAGNPEPELPTTHPESE